MTGEKKKKKMEEIDRKSIETQKREYSKTEKEEKITAGVKEKGQTKRKKETYSSSGSDSQAQINVGVINCLC